MSGWLAWVNEDYCSGRGWGNRPAGPQLPELPALSAHLSQPCVRLPTCVSPPSPAPLPPPPSCAVQDLQLDIQFGGMLIAAISVVSSGLQQIFVRTMQQKHKLSAHELLSNTAPAQAWTLIAIGPLLDKMVTADWVFNYSFTTGKAGGHGLHAGRQAGRQAWVACGVGWTDVRACWLAPKL